MLLNIAKHWATLFYPYPSASGDTVGGGAGGAGGVGGMGGMGGTGGAVVQAEEKPAVVHTLPSPYSKITAPRKPHRCSSGHASDNRY